MKHLLFLLSKWLCTNYAPIFSSPVYITAVSLQAQNASKERSINLTITWHGPLHLSHGVFQGYHIFYRNTKLGRDFNVTLRSRDSFYEIQSLSAYTEYRITARSFTLEGEGRMSNPILIWTASLGNFPLTQLVTCCLIAKVQTSFHFGEKFLIMN